MANKEEMNGMPAFGERAKALMPYIQKGDPKWSQDANWGGYRSGKMPQSISETLDLFEKGGKDSVSEDVDVEAYSPNRALMPYGVSNTYVRLLQDYPKEKVDKAFRAMRSRRDNPEIYTAYEETTPDEEWLSIYSPFLHASNYDPDKLYRTPTSRSEEIDLKVEDLSRKYGFLPKAIKDRALKAKAEAEKAEKAEMLKSLMNEFTEEELAQIANGSQDFE
jgi:hypothetical protein